MREVESLESNQPAATNTGHSDVLTFPFVSMGLMCFHVEL